MQAAQTWPPSETTLPTVEQPKGEGPHVCEHCQRRFKRREHLRRHQLVHSGSRPFECSICERAFPRKDMLQRHAVVHGDQAPAAVTLAGTPRVRAAHACHQCRDKKLRCDGRQPCSRCQLRRVPCTPSRRAASHDDHDSRGQANALAALMQSPAMFGTRPQSTDSRTLSRVLDTISRADVSKTGQLYQQVSSLASPTDDNSSHASQWTAAYARISEFHREQVRHVAVTKPTPLPDIDTFQTLVELYFDQVGPRLPLLHRGTFQPREDNWMLLLAMASLGCEYSSGCTWSLMALFEQLAIQAISATMTHLANITASTHQALLLMAVLLLFSGSGDSITFLQHHHSLLITLCRKLIARRIAEDASIAGPDLYQHKWNCFAEVEEERRLIYFTWIFDCLQHTVTGNPPIMSASEITRTMPCHRRLWNCTTETEWLMKYQEASPKQRSLASMVGKRTSPEELVNLDSTALITLLLTLSVERTRLDDLTRSYADEDDRLGPLRQAMQADILCITKLLQTREEKTKEPDFVLSYPTVSMLCLAPFPRLASVAGLHPPGSLQVTQAEDELKSLFTEQKVLAGRNMVHAARTILRAQKAQYTTRFDTQALVVAALYMRAFTTVMAHGNNSRASPVDPASRLDFQTTYELIRDEDRRIPPYDAILVAPRSEIAAQILSIAANIAKLSTITSMLAQRVADNFFGLAVPS